MPWEHAGGRGGNIAPLILNLGTKWRAVVRFRPWLLYNQKKRPWCPLNWKLGENCFCFACVGDETSLASAEIGTPDLSAYSLVGIVTTLAHIDWKRI
jgi:hypothetical protein